MNRLRQAEETVPSRSTLELNERLAATDSHRLRVAPILPKLQGLRKGLRRFADRADQVVTPALAGTTVAWTLLSFASQTLFFVHHRWTPSAADLLFAYCLTLLFALPLAVRKSRWHGWLAALTAWIGTSIPLAYSYGATLNAHWPWPEDGDKTLYFAQQ